jgi:signal transduction histidine kinase
MDFARQQLRSTINEAREAIWNLRQENDNDDNLVEKMESMAAQLSAEFHVPIACATTGAPFGLGHPLAHDLLMVAREAVFNAVLHGSPTRVDVTLGYNRRELTLSVVDDGCGFDQRAMESKNSHHFGLKGMRERVERWGGKFRLTSAVGKGVRIDVRMAKNR